MTLKVILKFSIDQMIYCILLHNIDDIAIKKIIDKNRKYNFQKHFGYLLNIITSIYQRSI